MHTAVALLLIAAVSLQSMAGCCCRAAQLLGEISMQASSEAPVSCCHHQHEGGNPRKTPPCKCCIDGGLSNAYVSTPKTSLDKPASQALHVSPAEMMPALGLLAAWGNCEHAAAEPGSRLPLYIVHQLLLL